MSYHFRSEQFEGPLDLLLSLIEKEKLDVTQLSLAEVADQYLEYMRQKENASLESMGAFLSVAARLILIKSRALLPILDFSDEEEEAMDDLEKRLKIYQLFRDTAARLGTLFETSHSAATRDSFLEKEAVFYPPKDVTKEVLREYFVSVLGEIPLFEELPEKELEMIVTLEEKITSLQETLKDKVESSFAEVISTAQNRVEVIISFLAMLELIKQRFIYVEQHQFFSHIKITRV